MRVLDLLADNALGLELTSAIPPERLQRSVTACSQSELMDPTPFVTRGEFLLTLGMGMHFQDFRTWDAYVERVTRAGVCGLALGLGTIHGTVPEGLVAACANHQLPLVVLAPDFPLVKLSRHIWQELAAERFEIARRGWSLADECAGLATSGAPLPEVILRVSETVGARVSLIDSMGFTLVAAGAVASGVRTRTTLRLPGQQHDQFQLRVEGAADTMFLQPLLGPACAVIAMQLSYTLTARSPLHSHTAARFIEGLVDPSSDAATLSSLARTAGFDSDAEWDCIILRRPEHVSNATLRLISWRLRVLLEEHYARVRFLDEPHQATLVMQRATNGRDPRLMLEAALEGSVDIDAAHGKQLRFDELAVAVQVARRTPLQTGVHSIATMDLASIIDTLPAGSLASLATRTLAPLGRSDGALFDTLEAYLELSGATRAVCDRLSIHRNTLTYRLKRIQELLDVDLDDGRTRATLLLALLVDRGRPAKAAE